MSSARRRTTTAVAAAVVVLAACGNGEPTTTEPDTPAMSPGREATTQPGDRTAVPPTAGPGPTEGTATAPAEPEVLATDLVVPWGIDFLSDGAALITERDTGRILQLAPGRQPEQVATVAQAQPANESGLLGLAVSPAFEETGHVFVYYTTATDNRVERMVHDGEELTSDVVVLDGIPREIIHSGGRIAFGPDGYLYVATGDAAEPYIAQQPDSLGGKILRVDEDGEPAPGNPTEGSPVWSSGHRNVQGLGWDAEGTMYASEFGANTWDELNLIEPGANYGWPEVEGPGGEADLTDPLHAWEPAEASPSGLAVTDEAIYVAALRGESLWRVPLERGGQIGEPQRLLEDEYGRLRSVTVAPDGRLWVLTSNTFRGEPSAGDDRVVALDEAWLAERAG